MRSTLVTTIAMGLCLTAATTLNACSTVPPGGNLAELQGLAASCEPTHKPATLVRADGSATAQSDALREQYIAVARDKALAAAICGGTFRFDIFGASLTDSITVASVSFDPIGATETAQLRSAAKRAQEVVDAIEDAYPDALAKLSSNGTDVVSSLQAGREFIDQINVNGPTHSLSLVLLTDGLDNHSAPLDDPGLTTPQAQSYVGSIPVPDLAGASVSIFGVGRVSGTSQLPSSHTDAVRAFYEALLARTGATTVTIATDYTGGR
ncbi:hypothetical protein [Herbiconiux daphne]|uniref:VWFA domain-containing protein n=1 Tax=Herbiconiux daphne TaxID=2970914 RepID=A0ABT2H552_9MICO|nr:hypothetical protein [Herbiconiux daphne]MCS5735058.1 hypothetical protein [Herbiconiux daphne]